MISDDDIDDDDVDDRDAVNKKNLDIGFRFPFGQELGELLFLEFLPEWPGFRKLWWRYNN